MRWINVIFGVWRSVGRQSPDTHLTHTLLLDEARRTVGFMTEWLKIIQFVYIFNGPV